jgi:hypothetical protein
MAKQSTVQANAEIVNGLANNEAHPEQLAAPRSKARYTPGRSNFLLLKMASSYRDAHQQFVMLGLGNAAHWLVHGNCWYGCMPGATLHGFSPHCETLRGR